MNHILKMMVLLAMTFGCAASPSDEVDTGEVSSATTQTCSQFCRNEGGPFYLSTPGIPSEDSCQQRGGDWYADPGCCCKCSRPGFCL